MYQWSSLWIVQNISILIKLGARLGGATKELLPNLDTYKNNEKSTIPLRFLFFGGCFGKQICSFLCVLLLLLRPGGRPSRYKSWLAFFLGPKIKNSVLILFARSPPKMHGQVRWSKFWSRDLTAKKYHRASVRPGGRPSRYKSWLAFLGGPKIQNSVPILFVRSTSKTHGHADINRKMLFFGSKIFINFGFCRKYARSGTIL